MKKKTLKLIEMDLQINQLVIKNLNNVPTDAKTVFPLKLTIIIVYDNKPKDFKLYFDLLQTLLSSFITSYKLSYNYYDQPEQIILKELINEPFSCLISVILVSIERINEYDFNGSTMLFYPTLEQSPIGLNELVTKLNSIPYYTQIPLVLIPYKITLPTLPKLLGIVKIKTFSEVLSSFNYAFCWALSTCKPFPLTSITSLPEFLSSMKPQLSTIYYDTNPEDPSSFIISYNAFIETISFFITDEASIKLFQIESWFVNKNTKSLLYYIINNINEYVSLIKIALKKYRLPEYQWPEELTIEHIVGYAKMICDPTVILKGNEIAFIVSQNKKNQLFDAIKGKKSIEEVMKNIIEFVFDCAIKEIKEIKIIIPAVRFDNAPSSASYECDVLYQSVLQSITEKEEKKPKKNSLTKGIKESKSFSLMESLKELNIVSPQSLKNLVLKRELLYWKEDVDYLTKQLKQLKID